MSAPARDPVVFVVGCPRSGTTLLRRMLDNHPALAVSNDTHFIPRYLPADGPDAPLPEERLAELVDSRRFARFGLPADAVRRAAEHASYRRFVTHVYAEFAAANGKALAGEKTPDYVRHIPLLADLFPDARFVHLVRDGRDVALSLQQWASPSRGPGRFGLWQAEPVATSALWWERFARDGRRAGRELPADRYREVRYEDLVADPTAEAKRIVSFLELAWNDAVVNFHVGRHRAVPGQSAKKAWMPPTSGLRDWRRDMDERSRLLFEAVAGATLEDFGYPVSSATPTPDIVGLAARCRAWWEVDRKRDHARVPAWTAPARAFPGESKADTC